MVYALHQLPVAPVARDAQLGQAQLVFPALSLSQGLRLSPERHAPTMKVDEDGDLLPDDIRVERLDEVVDRADRIGPVDLTDVGGQGGEEDDGDVAGSFDLFEMVGDLEAVHAGHHHIEEDE